MKDEKDYSLDNGYMSIHEVLASNGINQRNLLNEVNRNELIEDGRESVDSVESEIKSNKVKTNLEKGRFISDIKGGLGKSIKENPNTVKHIVNDVKLTLFDRFINTIKKMFIRF